MILFEIILISLYLIKKENKMLFDKGNFFLLCIRIIKLVKQNAKGTNTTKRHTSLNVLTLQMYEVTQKNQTKASKCI